MPALRLATTNETIETTSSPAKSGTVAPSKAKKLSALDDLSDLVHAVADGPIELFSTTCKKIKTPDVTLEEDFLPDVKILKTVDHCGSLPPPAEILKLSTKRRIVVGVSGVSCGGKTTVARAVSEWLGEYGDMIMQDDFYKPASDLPINPITNFPEFDEPESVHMQQIEDAILAWQNADDGDNDKRVLLVEGTMIFTNRAIAQLCDLRYMIHVDFATAEYRRSLRRYPIPDPPQVVAKNIWPKYIKHRQMFTLIAEECALISKQIDGTEPVERIVAGIIQDVKLSKHG
jgi:uridine kinase